MNNTNYEILKKETLHVPYAPHAYDCGEVVEDPAFYGMTTDTYLVTNSAWNNALNDTARHAPFARYMEKQLSCTDIQGITKGTDGRFTFSALDY